MRCCFYHNFDAWASEPHEIQDWWELQKTACCVIYMHASSHRPTRLNSRPLYRTRLEYIICYVRSRKAKQLSTATRDAQIMPLGKRKHKFCRHAKALRYSLTRLRSSTTMSLNTGYDRPLIEISLLSWFLVFQLPNPSQPA